MRPQDRILKVLEGKRQPGSIVSAILILAFLFLGLIAPYLFQNFGAITPYDESYQSLCVRHWSQCPLAMLSFFQAHLWQHIFGPGVLALRWLNVFVLQLTAVVCLCYGMRCYRKSSTTPLTCPRLILWASFWLALCMTGARMNNEPSYTWDSGALPYVALLLITTLSYEVNPRGWKAALAGAFAALLTLAHVPYVVFLPALFILIIWRQWRQWPTAATDIAAALAAFAITFVAVTTLMCGSPAAYIATFTPENIISGHDSLTDFFFPLKQGLPRMMYYMMPLSACFVLAWLFHRLRTKSLWAYLLLALLGAALAVKIMKYYLYPDFFGLLSDFAMPPFWIMLIYIWAYNQTHNNPLNPPTAILWTIALAALLLGFGSDHWFQRFRGLFFALPIVWAFVWPRLNNPSRHLLRIFLQFCLLALVATVGVRLYKAHQYCTADFSDIPLHHAIADAPEVHDKFQAWSLEHQKIQAAHLSMAAVGPATRYPFLFTFAKNIPAPQLQQFHYADSDPGARRYLQSLLGRYEVIVLASEPDDRKAWTLAQLSHAGYSLRSTLGELSFFSRKPY